MKYARESFHTAPITRCALSWRGWIWRAFDLALDFLLLAAAGTMIGYALANLCYS
jgi:hypothetical protein